jgi:hypothetical protein
MNTREQTHIQNRGGVNRLCPGLEMLEQRIVLSTFRVNTTLDTVAVSLKTGKDASGHISLRSAIMAADAKPNADTIIIPGGLYTLTIPGAGEDNDASGDLDIVGNLTIKGKGAGHTTIDGNGLDRVIQILSGKVSISGVTIEHGIVTGQGAGILNSGGRVSLTSVTIANNIVDGATGADAAGSNGATGGAGSAAQGGGISNAAGSLSISKCVITSNVAYGGYGGAGATGTPDVVIGGITGENGGSAVGGVGGAGGDLQQHGLRWYWRRWR